MLLIEIYLSEKLIVDRVPPSFSFNLVKLVLFFVFLCKIELEQFKALDVAQLEYQGLVFIWNVRINFLKSKDCVAL